MRQPVTLTGTTRLTGKPKVWWLGIGFLLGLWAGDIYAVLVPMKEGQFKKGEDHDS